MDHLAKVIKTRFQLKLSMLVDDNFKKVIRCELGRFLPGFAHGSSPFLYVKRANSACLRTIFALASFL
jgi:hypothetical protein